MRYIICMNDVCVVDNISGERKIIILRGGGVRGGGGGLFFFQAEDGIGHLVRSRGLGDVYKRQAQHHSAGAGSRVACHHRPDASAGASRRHADSLQ